MEELTLIEILDRIRNKYKSIAFECAVVTNSMHGIDWTDKERVVCINTIRYMVEDIERLERRIEKGQYKEVNSYGL